MLSVRTTVSPVLLVQSLGAEGSRGKDEEKEKMGKRAGGLASSTTIVLNCNTHLLVQKPAAAEPPASFAFLTVVHRHGKVVYLAWTVTSGHIKHRGSGTGPYSACLTGNCMLSSPSTSRSVRAALAHPPAIYSKRGSNHHHGVVQSLEAFCSCALE